MAFILSKHHRYSNDERRIFDMLPMGRVGVTSTMIASQVYGRRLTGRTQVVAVVRGLTAKVKRNREPFKICKSPRRGPHPSEFWLEKK